MAITSTTAPAERTSGRVTYDGVTRTVAATLGNPGKGYYALLGTAVTMSPSRTLRFSSRA